MPPEGAQERYMWLCRAYVYCAGVCWGHPVRKMTVFGPFWADLGAAAAFFYFLAFEKTKNDLRFPM